MSWSECFQWGFIVGAWVLAYKIGAQVDRLQQWKDGKL